MTPKELYDLFRADTTDNVAPYLWTDTEVYAYMNDAYYMFVRLIGGIPDYSSPICTVKATKEEPFSDIDPAILFIRQATLEPDGRAVKVINAQDMERLTDEDFGVLRRINNSNTIGKVRYLVMGMEDNVVRWVNVPDADVDVHLLVERLPLATITGAEPDPDDPEAVPESFEGVKAHHHFHFLKWMKHLAYAKQDAETFDKVKSEEQKAAFVQYCDMAKREKEKYKHKVRVVQYGGL